LIRTYCRGLRNWAITSAASSTRPVDASLFWASFMERAAPLPTLVSKSEESTALPLDESITCSPVLKEYFFSTGPIIIHVQSICAGWPFCVKQPVPVA